ncbi:MAG: exosortase/archaeosortase family protein [Candidatus Aquicultorales bacterium]
MAKQERGTGKRPTGGGRGRDRWQVAMALRFGAIALFGILLLNYPNPLGRVAGDLLIESTTAVSVALMRLARLPVEVDGAVISVPNQTLIVTLECTAVYLMMIYSGLVVAYPASIKGKIVGLAAGLPAIFLVNIARLVMVSFVAYASPYIFRQVHDFIWQVLFVILVMIIWVVWMEVIVDRAERAPVSR